MMQIAIPSCTVSVHDGKQAFVVDLRHYEELRDRLDRRETGWVELDSAWGDGKVFVQLESIKDLALHSPQFCEEYNEHCAREAE